jgi:EmrB/QacA subfamily drug resistance transporter
MAISDQVARVGQQQKVTFAVLALAGMSFSLLQSLVAPALPAIQHSLHTTPGAVTWVLTAYLLSACVATPILGRLGDMFGKARMLVVAIAAFGIGLLMAAVATSIEVLIAARVVQGFAGAIFPLAFGIIRDEFPRDQVHGRIALMSSLLAVGGGAGIVLAGPIVDHFSYHSLFWFPLGAVAVAGIAAVAFVPESPIRSLGRVNVSGAFLLSAWLACLLLGTSEGATWGWADPRVIALYTGSAVLLLAWIRNELSAAEPLVDVRMLSLRGVWPVNAAAFLIGAALFSSLLLIPQFVAAPTSNGYGFGDSVTAAGLTLLPLTVMMLVFGPISGRMSQRLGGEFPLACGAGAVTLGFTFLAVAHSHRIDFYFASGLLGIGIGLSFAAMANLVIDAVPASQTSVATGINTVMRTLGGAIGGQVAGSVLASTLSVADVPTQSGFTIAFTIMAVGGGLAVICALAVPRTRRPARLSPS